jgi:hypothetical protein
MTKIKVKINFPVHDMKGYRELGGLAPLILSFGARWRRVVNCTTLPLYFQKDTVTYGIGSWVDHRASLEFVVKKKIFGP